MPIVPFEMSDPNGIVETSGLLFLEDEFLVFDFQAKRWGLFDDPPEKVKAEVTVIQSIQLQRGIFKDKLIIVPKRTELLRAVPGSAKGELKLKIAKRHRGDAEALVEEIRFRARMIRDA